MTAYVDPVTQGSEYQQLLLRLLGDRDPAEVMQRTPGQLRKLAAEAGEALRARPDTKEWSVFECIAHVIDAELVISGRLRFFSLTTSRRSLATTRTCGSIACINPTTSRSTS